MALKLHWGNCQGDVWCSLLSVNLTHPIFDAYGVYIIWSKETTIKVGHGNFRTELLSDRSNPQINIYNGAKITWAEVKHEEVIAVRNFILNRLKPIIVDENIRTLEPMIEVNFPWW